MTYRSLQLLLFTAVGVLNALAANDPIEVFLQKAPPYMRESGRYYSNDQLLRLDLDLNNDGAKEVLLSLNRDRDGKQGNVWAVYRRSGDDLIESGAMTFNRSRFYLGPLGDGKYGLATFGPSGAGEGIIWAYVFDGTRVGQVKLGEVTLNRQTMKLEGEDILDKYLGANAVRGDDVVTTIGVDELVQKYGIKVQTKTYQRALQDGLIADAPSPNAGPHSQSTSVPPSLQSIPPSESPRDVEKSLSPALKLSHPEQSSTPWPWIIGGFILLSVMAGILFKFPRK